MKTALGKCVVCGIETYTDEHGGDPRGACGLSASNALVAEEYGQQGADVPLCWGCGQERPRYECAVKIALNRWEAQS